MNETEKLQRAVDLTIAAGYQLDRDAFEFLSMLATTEDPASFMTKAIRQIEDLQDKPFFIEKHFLEELLSSAGSAQEIVYERLEPSSPEAPKTEATQITEGKVPFHPYTLDIESELKVIEDPGSQIETRGTIENYLGYFQDRFKQLERLLRQRMDVKSATSIMDAVKAQPNARLKVIGMVTERRESKQKTFLTVEDMKGSTTILVPQNASMD